MSPSDPAQHFTIRKIKPQRINQHFPHNSIETATFLHSTPSPGIENSEENERSLLRNGG